MGQPEEVFGVQATSPTSGSIDMSDVQYKYIYRPDDPDTFSGEDKANGVWFTAEPMNEADADALRIFIVGFSHKRTEGGDEEIINTGTDEAQWLGLKSDWALTGTVYDGSLAYVSVSKANYFVGVALHDRFTFGKVSFAEEKIGPSPSLSGKYPASSIEPIDIEFDAE